MHISEGVLSPAVLGAGAVLAAAGIVIGLRKLDYDRLMTVAILAAAFFVGSLIHVPIGPSSVHLILNGLLGMLLGWAAFPSIFVALMLQAILFQYGGITVLGVNTFNMAFPAVVCYYAFRPMLLKSARQRIVGAFCCGALSVAGAGLLMQPEVLLADALASGSLVRVLEAWTPQPRPVHLLWRQDRRPLPKLTQFIAHLQQGMADALTTTRASE